MADLPCGLCQDIDYDGPLSDPHDDCLVLMDEYEEATWD